MKPSNGRQWLVALLVSILIAVLGWTWTSHVQQVATLEARSADHDVAIGSIGEHLKNIERSVDRIEKFLAIQKGAIP